MTPEERAEAANQLNIALTGIESGYIVGIALTVVHNDNTCGTFAAYDADRMKDVWVTIRWLAERMLGGDIPAITEAPN